MRKDGDNLTIALKTKGRVQERKYKDVPTEVIAKLFYLNTAAACLQYYACHIKGKFQVLSVTNL
jgi:hypothetical protein